MGVGFGFGLRGGGGGGPLFPVTPEEALDEAEYGGGGAPNELDGGGGGAFLYAAALDTAREGAVVADPAEDDVATDGDRPTPF